MHSDGGGKSFAISSSGGNFGFSKSSGGGSVAALVELVDAFDLCLLLFLLWLDDDDDDDVAVAFDDVDGEPVTVKLLPDDLLLDAAIDTLSDLDDVRMGCNIPGKKHQLNRNIDANHTNEQCIWVAQNAVHLPSASAKLVPIE